MNFYKCNHCKNVATKLYDSGVPLICCGESMHKLIANTIDEKKEKHVPIYNIEGNILNVEVGSIPHPMTEAHYIVFIAVKNGDREIIVNLKPQNEKAKAKIIIDPDKDTHIYEYCNLHGLWSTKIK